MQCDTFANVTKIPVIKDVASHEKDMASHQGCVLTLMMWLHIKDVA